VEFKDFAFGGILMAQQINVVIWVESGFGGHVREIRQLRPMTTSQNEMFKLSAIAIFNFAQNDAAIFGGLQMDFGNFWKLFTESISILIERRADFMKINLLIEMDVFGGPFGVLRIPRIVESGCIAIPC